MTDYRDRLDEVARFVEETEGKVYPRRVFLSMCAILGIAPAMARLTPAMADAKELVLCNWGGDAIKGMKAAWVDRYLAKFPDRKDKKELVKLKKGEHLKLRYGLYLHASDVKEGKVAQVYAKFTKLAGK